MLYKLRKFVMEIQMILVNILYGLRFEFFHELKPCLVDIQFHVKAMVSVVFWYGGTVFPAITNSAVFSVQLLKSYSYWLTLNGEPDNRKLSAWSLCYLTLFSEHSLLLCLLEVQKNLMNFSAAQFSGPTAEQRMEWSRCV